MMMMMMMIELRIGKTLHLISIGAIWHIKSIIGNTRWAKITTVDSFAIIKSKFLFYILLLFKYSNFILAGKAGISPASAVLI